MATLHVSGLSFASVFTAALLCCSAAAQAQGWQGDINWSRQDRGATGCDQQYLQTLPECLITGKRVCLMGHAVQAAADNNCSWAMRLTLITQCHNGAAQDRLNRAGERDVCRYLAQFGTPTPSRTTNHVAPPTTVTPAGQTTPQAITTSNSMSIYLDGRYILSDQTRLIEVKDTVCNLDKGTHSLRGNRRIRIEICQDDSGYGRIEYRNVTNNGPWIGSSFLRHGESVSP